MTAERERTKFETGNLKLENGAKLRGSGFEFCAPRKREKMGETQNSKIVRISSFRFPVSSFEFPVSNFVPSEWKRL